MPEHFLRYTPPDPAAHDRSLENARAALSAARAGGDAVALIDCAGDLASLLTSVRREAEARELLLPLSASAREHPSLEPTGWYWLALGTASQYLSLRADANAMFDEAVTQARLHGWENLEHFVLHHWGRLLAEEQDFPRARECFSQALAIRARRDLPGLQASSQRALDTLAELEAGSVGR